MGKQSDKSIRAGGSGGTLRAAGTVGGWTLLSRLLGFARDILLARVLGAGPLADAFFVAFKLPNFFRRMFAEGTLTVALMPVLADRRRAGEEEAHRFLDALAGLLLTALTLFTILGVLFMPWLLLLFAPGFRDEPDRWAQALLLGRWMFPYLLLISLSAMGWAVLNSYKRFSLAAASPALLNLAIIFAAVVLAPSMANPALALAFGVLLGGALQLGVQIPALARVGWRPRPTLAWRTPAIGETLRLFGPALLGVAAVQVNILVGTILATLLPVGAVSYLYYADRIVQLPLALFGIAMGTALLPALSEHFSGGRTRAAADELRDGLTWLTWITLPATVGLLWLAEPIIVTLFEHGRFTGEAAAATADALRAYAAGLVAYCWARVLANACFAGKDARAPMHYAAVSVAANIALALLLMGPLAHTGLALATSLAAFVNVALLLRRARARLGPLFDRRAATRMLRAAIACLPMLAYLYGLEQMWHFPAELKPMQALWTATAVGGGAALFFGAAWMLGERALLRRRRR